MADSLARLIVMLEANTAAYQEGLQKANENLADFGRKTEVHLRSMDTRFRTFSRGIASIFTGGGIFIAVTQSVRTLETMAKKLADTDPAAARFMSSMDSIGDTLLHSLGQPAIQATEPFFTSMAEWLKTGAEYLDAFREKVRQAGTEWGKLAAQKPDKSWLERFAESASTGFGTTGPTEATAPGQPTTAQAAAALESAKAQAELGKSILAGQTIADNFYKAAKAKDELAKGIAEIIAVQEKADDKIRAERDKKDQEYQDKLTKIRRDNAQADVDAEMASINYIYKQKDALAESVAKAVQASDKEFDEMQKKRDRQTQAIGDLFAANLVEYSKVGFKGLLEQWGKTLLQMIVMAQAKRVWESIFPKGFSSGPEGPGGWIGGIAKILGFAGGGDVMGGRPILVGERGPEIFTPPSSGRIIPNGGMGNIYIDARYSRDPQATAQAVRVAVTQANLKSKDDRRRGRTR